MKAEMSYVWWLAASVGLALALSWVMGKLKEHRETEEERQRMLARLCKNEFELAIRCFDKKRGSQ